MNTSAKKKMVTTDLEKIHKAIFSKRGILLIEGQSHWIRLVGELFKIKNIEEIISENQMIENGIPGHYKIGNIRIMYAPKLEVKMQTAIIIK